MGLVVIVALGLYLLISIAAVSGVANYAKARGKDAINWGIGAALVMFLIPFWDWIPTVAMHKYYCSTEAGFWVYKTPEQWKQENPGVMEGLVSYNKDPSGFNVNWPSQHEQRNDGHQEISTNNVNARFNEVVSQQDISSVFSIIRKEKVLFDIKKNDVIARYIDFGSGNSVKNTAGPPGPLKFWQVNRSCAGGKEREIKFGNFYIQFKGTEK